MLRMLLFVSFSLLVGCGIPRPDTTLYIVNAPGKVLRGYNLKNDYDDSGTLKPGAKPTLKNAETIDDVNKYACTDPQGFANLKAYVATVRDELAKCQSSH